MLLHLVLCLMLHCTACAQLLCVHRPYVSLQVTQSRQAVDVSDAVGLVKQLEALTGAVDYEEVIAQHSTGLEHLAASMEDTKAEIDRCACCAVAC